MRNIFELTKREQRLVVIIMIVLVTATITRHFWSSRAPLPQTPSTSTQAKQPPIHPEEEQTDRDDSH